MTTQFNTLIRLRQYDVDCERMQLAALQRDELDLLDRLSEMDHQLECQRSDLETLSRSGELNIAALCLRRPYLQQLATQRTELHSQLSARQQSTRVCRERLLAADQRLQAVEKLRERALVTERAQDARQDAAETEEAWLWRYNRASPHS